MEQMENILLQVIVSPQDLSKYSLVLDGYFTNQPFLFIRFIFIKTFFIQKMNWKIIEEALQTKTMAMKIKIKVNKYRLTSCASMKYDLMQKLPIY